MDILYLNVKTVPAFDALCQLPHTAYSVYSTINGRLIIASGWTLKDAIELFCRTQGYDPDCIRLKRPFIAQKTHSLPIYTREI